MIVLFDIDDVIVDWRGAAAQLVGEHVHELCDNWMAGFETTDTPSLTHNELWAFIKAHPAFWLDLQKTLWADELIGYVEDKGFEWFFCSTPSRNDIRSSTQKIAWMDANGWDADEKSVLTKQKWLLANPDRILIDDKDINCEEFRDHCGHAILMPQPWNKARKHVDDRLGYVIKNLVLISDL